MPESKPSIPPLPSVVRVELPQAERVLRMVELYEQAYGPLDAAELEAIARFRQRVGEARSRFLGGVPQ